MTINNITFKISDNDCRIYAICDGKSVGSIFFIKIGTDKIMISESEIDPSYKDSDIELNMVQQIIQMAREQHRKVMTICQYISNIFKNHPEFDDVRLLNNGR
jgi:predicted GNAT family acetyltransferase